MSGIFLTPVIGAAAAAADSPGPEAARWGAQSVCAAVGAGRPRHSTPRRGCQPQGLP